MKAAKEKAEFVRQDLKVDLKKINLQQVAEKLEGYTGSDVTVLCKEAAMGPIRDLFAQGSDKVVDEISSSLHLSSRSGSSYESCPLVLTILQALRGQIRAITARDFKYAFKRTRPSVSKKLIQVIIPSLPFTRQACAGSLVLEGGIVVLLTVRAVLYYGTVSVTSSRGSNPGR